ncbi:MAG: transglutaminase-like domain-containing protein [Candidatus Helarchaeota archaeon]
MSSEVDTRTAESRKRSEKRYVRHPFITFILLFSLIFSALVILSALPFSFFLNLGTSNFRFEDFPEGSIDFDFNPDEFQLPDWFMDLPWQDFLDNLPDDLNLTDLLPLLMTIIMFNATPLNEAHKWRGEVYDIYQGTDDWGKDNTTTSIVPNVTAGNGLGNNRTQTLMFKTLMTQRQTYQVTIPQYEVQDGIFGISDISAAYNDSHPFGGDYYEIIEQDEYGFYRVTCGPFDPGYDIYINVTIEYQRKLVGDYLGAQLSNISAVPASIISQYTQVPASPGLNWSMVQQLAGALDNETGGSSASIYSKASYVENFLKTNYNYSYEYLRYGGVYTLPSGQDAVYNFLFERGGDNHHNITVNGTAFPRNEDGIPGEGICMDYAKAFVMLLRLMGIPARYVEGFASDPNSRDVSTNIESVYAIQAHAWAEVYLPVSGGGGVWWPFDPTGSIMSPEPPQPDQPGQGYGSGPPSEPGDGGEMPTGDDVFQGQPGGGFGDGVGGDPNSGIGGMGGGEGIWGIGTNPYGDNRFEVYISPTIPNRYFKITSYDLYNPTNWEQSSNVRYNSSEVNMNVSSALPGSQEYNITIIVNATGNSTTENPYYEMPLISLSSFNSTTGVPKLINNTFTTNASSSKIISNGLYTDDYGTLIWNVSHANIPETGYGYQISYNITFEKINLEEVKNQIPSNSLNNPGMPVERTQIDYAQLPGIVNQSLIDFIQNNFKLNNDVYNTTLNLIEYLKTNYVFTPLIERSGYDLDAFLSTHMGTNGDFATALVTFLRILNISARLVWGGLGYETSGSTMRKITNAHYWVEAWVPNGSSIGDGYWVQFDPTPFPEMVYDIVNNGFFAPRVFDAQVDTFHYDMRLQSNLTSPYGYVNRGDQINLGAAIYRNNNTLIIYDSTHRINETLSGKNLNVSFYDTINDSYFAINVTINLNGFANTTYIPNSSLRIGPHGIIASYIALFNDTLYTLNGSVNVTVSSISPQEMARSLTPITIQGTLKDAIKNENLNGLYVSLNTSIDWLTPNQTQTDQNGIFNDVFNLDPSHEPGIYNVTAYFNGTFNLTYPFPYNLFKPNSITVPGMENVSKFVDGVTNITVYAASIIDNMTVWCPAFPGEKIVNGFNTSISGNLAFDNLTTIVGETVWFGWDNGTLYNVSSAITQANGYFEMNYTVPPDTGPANVDIYSIFNTTGAIRGCQNTSDPIPKTPVDVHIYSANPTNITLGQEQLTVTGNVTFVVNGTGYNGLPFYLSLNGTDMTTISNTTNGSGNFSITLTISSTVTEGCYNLTINSTDFTNHPIKVNYTWTKYVNLTRASQILQSNIYVNQSQYDPSNISYYQRNERIKITGYLNDTDGNPLLGVHVIHFYLDSFNLGTTFTNPTGRFDFIPLIPAGAQLQNREIKIEFKGDSYVEGSERNFTIYIFNTVNIIIDDPTPLGTKGINTPITVTGNVTDVFNNPIKNRLVYIDFNNTQLGLVLAGTTDASGHFSHVNTSTHQIGNYNCSAYFPAYTSNKSSSKFFNVNATTSLSSVLVSNSTYAPTATTSIFIQKGEYVSVSGLLLIETNPWDNNTYGNANVTIWFNGTEYLGSQFVNSSGNFNIEVQIPNSEAKKHFIQVRFDSIPFVLGTNYNYTNVNVFEDISSALTLTLTINGNNAENTPTYVKVGSTLTVSGTVTSTYWSGGNGGIGLRTISLYSNNGTSDFLIQQLITSASGSFSCSIQIPLNLNSLGNYNITVGILAQNGKNSSVFIPFNLRVNHTPTFITKQIQNPNDFTLLTLNPTTNLFFYSGESLVIQGNFYQNNPSFTNISLTLRLYNETHLLNSQTTTSGTGFFSFSYNTQYFDKGYHELMIKYDGSGSFDDPFSFNFTIYVFNTVILTLNNPGDKYWGDSAIFTGTFTDGSVNIQGRNLRFYETPGIFQGYTTVTNNAGSFTFTYTVPSYGDNESFYVEFRDQSSTPRNTSSVITVNYLGMRPPTPFNPIPLIIILVVVAVGILSTIIVYKINQIQQEKKAKEVDIKRIKSKRDLLLEGKRYREAIIYNFENLLYLINGYLKRKPSSGETYREFIDDIIKNVRTYIGANLMIPFVSIYEEARWSNHKMTLSLYKESEEYYNKLFKKIVGLTPEDYISKKEEEELPKTPESSINNGIEQKASS